MTQAPARVLEQGFEGSTMPGFTRFVAKFGGGLELSGD